MTWSVSFSTTGADLYFSGEVAGAEILEAKRQFFTHEFPGDAHWVLCDFTQATSFDITVADVKKIVEQDKKAVRRLDKLLEVVVAPAEVLYGLARMWQAQVAIERSHAAVVRARGDALDWLRDRGVSGLPGLPGRTESLPMDRPAQLDARE